MAYVFCVISDYSVRGSEGIDCKDELHIKHDCQIIKVLTNDLQTKLRA